jgi:hypothetical protein
MPLPLESTRADATAYLPVAGDGSTDGGPSNLDAKVAALQTYTEQAGFVYEPWQVAAFVTAVRTKPFVVLAGVSGLGKTKLPRLVAEATGADLRITPVKPDWTDSSEVVGYEDLTGDFHPGALLREAEAATGDSENEHFFLLDEMNLARVEYYLAEFLSLLEERQRDQGDGRIKSPPLAEAAPPDSSGKDWSGIYLPGNLAVVGSVNMDETTHGFSRKVLDRGFILEFGDVDLANFGNPGTPSPQTWTASDWEGDYLRITEHPNLNDPIIQDVVQVLSKLNDHLSELQLHFGYRVRDEIALFCINAHAVVPQFVTLGGEDVDPLDLAIMMKVLPRIQGGSQGLRTLLDALATWAAGGETGTERQFPFCAKRIAIMRERFDQEGFTSFWL